jgi:CRP-like cAMP-binding protein
MRTPEQRDAYFTVLAELAGFTRDECDNVRVLVAVSWAAVEGGSVVLSPADLAEWTGLTPERVAAAAHRLADRGDITLTPDPFGAAW